MYHMRFATLTTITLTLVSSAFAADWPRWLGEQGDSTWRENRVISDIPVGGLKTKWEAKLGLGYSGPAVANGKVYVMDYLRESGDIANNAGAPDQLSGTERVLCLDEKTGELIWEHAYQRDYMVSYGSGPRSTPNVSEGKTYALGAEGDLLCLDANSGKVIWSKRFSEDYGAQTPMWGHAAHPLVYNDMLISIVGGEGSVVVAFDKDTGEEKWKALSASSQGYCPPSIITHNEVEQLIIWHAEAVNGLNPNTGELYWSQPLRPNWGGSIQVPRKRGARLFVGGPSVASLFQLENQSGSPSARQLWKGNSRSAVYPVNSSVIFTQEAIYSVDSGTSALTAVSIENGERLWETTEPVLADPNQRGRHGTAFPVRYKNTDTYYILNENGELIIAELTPKEYSEKGRTQVIEPSNTTNAGGTRSVVWSHPAFANRTLYVRNDNKLVAVDLDASSY